MSKREERRQSNAEYKAAQERLSKLSKAQQRRGVRDENKSFWHQNAAVAEASRKASWWNR